MRALPLGRVVVDLAGSELLTDDIARLMHPQVGGVILFSRNFASLGQLTSLCAAIRSLRTPGLVIAARVPWLGERWWRIPRK